MRQWLLLVSLLMWASTALALAPDKEQHAQAGAAVGTSVALMSRASGTNEVLAVTFGALSGCAVNAAKEAYDYMGYGTPDRKDFLYGCLGALTGALFGQGARRFLSARYLYFLSDERLFLGIQIPLFPDLSPIPAGPRSDPDPPGLPPLPFALTP